MGVGKPYSVNVVVVSFFVIVTIEPAPIAPRCVVIPAPARREVAVVADRLSGLADIRRKLVRLGVCVADGAVAVVLHKREREKGGEGEGGGVASPLGSALPLPAGERVVRLRVEIGQRIADARADDGIVLDDFAIEIFNGDVQHFRATIAERLDFRAVKVDRAVNGDFYGFDVHQGRG